MDATSFRRSASRAFPLLVILALGASGAASAATRYAIPSGGATSGSCGDWATACTLQTALAVATSGDQAWVEAGLYLPTTDLVMTPTSTDRGMSFDIPPGVAVYGGFAGTEASLVQRDPAANPTILSGDIDGDDTNTDGNSIDEASTDIQGANSYHVVTMDGTGGTPITATTVLDGFTITGGDANGDAFDSFGGGLFCNGSGAVSRCSPSFTDVTFTGNSTSIFGGAIYNYGSYGTSSPSFTNVTFTGNTAAYGGAIYDDGYSGTSSPSFTDVTFTGNTAGYGGAIYDDGSSGTTSPSFTNVTFTGNTAAFGGAIYNYGSYGTSSPSFTNATFTGNTSDFYGGAIYNYGAFGTSSPTFTNVTFTGNTAGLDGGAIYNSGFSGTTSPSFTNVILWGDTAGVLDSEISNFFAAPTIDHSVVEGGCASIPGAACGLGNLDTDPVLGPLQDNGGPTETIALGAGSSAIDAADDGACPSTDQRGFLRPQGAHCDIGAYELDTTGPTVESTSLATTYVTTGPASFTVTFSEPVADPAGDSDPDDATNPANYLLVEAGGNATFDTLSCSGGVASDDTQVPVAGVTYDGGTLTATVSLGSPLPLGTYRLFVCGTTSITDLAGNPLNGGTDSTFDLAVLAITEVPALGPAGLALLALLLAAGALALLRRG